LLDLGAFTPFLYAFDDREKILDILDRVTGSRLTYCYGRFGGVVLDVDDIFLKNVADFCTYFKDRFEIYTNLVIDNVIFQERSVGIGIFEQDLIQKYGVSGPALRAMGHAYDVRKDEPYGIYDRFEFDIPTQQAGDCFARSLVRMDEMLQSVRIIEQAVKDIPEGPFMAPKVPKRIRPAEGEYHFSVESARGNFGMYIVSDGTDIPFRLKLRTPSFANMATMPNVMKGSLLSDAVAILGSIDIVVPEIDR
jgi:NADH-quinone oxidoreductase subunit D